MLRTVTVIAIEMQSLTLLLVLILKLVLDASTKQVCYVKPNNYSLNCPNQPCLTLDQYAEQQKSYFTTGATFKFLPGDHYSHTMVSLKNVSDIVLREIENDSDVITVFCKTGMFIQFENVTNLIIQGITFMLCSGDPDKNLSVMEFLDSKEVLFLNLTFQGYSDPNKILVRAIYCDHSNIEIISCLFKGNTGDYGGAIFASGGSNITLNGNIFTENKAIQTGGAISAYQSSLILKETLGNIFTYNSAGLNGGALYCMSSKIEIASDNATEISPAILINEEASSGADFTDCSKEQAHYSGPVMLPFSFEGLQPYNSYFSNNKAYQGGAIYLYNYSVASLSGTVIMFQNNSARVGGAIANSKSTVTSNAKELSFCGNKAEVGGGAYFGNYGSLNLGELDTNTHYFAHNSGGAISYQNGNLTISGNSHFKSNIGGAIHASKCNLTLLGRVLFKYNYAKAGGAIYLFSTIALLDGMVVDFVSNSATLGGAIYSDGSIVTSITKQLCFTGNRAQLAGGAFFGNKGSLKLGEVMNNTHYFADNSAGRNTGGAIHYHLGSLQIQGNSHFTSNYVNYVGIDGIGGAIFAVSCDFTLSGRALFTYNHAQQGGAIYINNTTALFDGMAIDFVNNSANTLGGGVAIALSRLVTKAKQAKQLNFIGNSALQGGGISSINSSYGITSANFINNTATEIGGAIASFGDTISCHNVNITGNSRSALTLFNSNLSFSGDTTICRNIGKIGGGITAKMSFVSFSGFTTFEENNALASGGAISGEYKTTLSFSGNTSFTNNRAVYYGGAIHGYIKMELTMRGESLFKNNSIDVGGGGAIFASDTHITFNQTINFMSNLAQNGSGGAMYLENGATMILEQNTTLITSCNHANKYGGAMYHADSITPSQCTFVMSEKTPDSILTLPNCFLDLRGILFNTNNTPFVIHSFNDSAGGDGSFLYGGLVDKCRIFSLVPSKLYVNATEIDSDILYTVLMDQNILEIKSRDTETKAIASEAYTLCFCKSNQEYNCSEETNIETYRGQTFSMSLLSLSQGDTITSTLLTAILSPTARLKLNQSSQVLPQNCTDLEYNLYSTKEKEKLVLYPDGSCRDTGEARVVINVKFRPCPDAFTLHGDQCICEERLQAYNAECMIFDHEAYVTRKAESKFWLTALYSNGKYQGLILYQTCPVQYCKTKAVNITLSQPDIQCNLNRSGVLCGACAINYSLLLGGSKCEICSNTHLALLPLFLAAGIILVAFLSFLRFTVATGMINSIILYANIVQANRNIFFPGSANVLTVFIAWMNLDLGFQTCFYQGMDAYAQTFLQFAFPIYIWILISLIIITSRYSIILTKLIGSNPIAVLATLLLMSYTKILKIIVEVYSFGRLDYPDSKTITVWLRDANVPYLQSKHLLLTVVTSLVLVFLFLPYTLFLLLGYKLYRFSGRRKYLRWLNRIKPLLDSYYAPYNIHTRYWTGFLLLVRCALYIVFSFNSLGGTTTDRSIIVTFTAIIVIAWLSVKIYKNFYANAIEASVYLNLIILSAFTPSSPALVYSLVGTVFATTIGIIVYHFHILYTAKSKNWQKIVAKVTYSIETLKNRTSHTTEQTPLLAPANTSSHDPHKIVSKTVINLREPLLDN